MKNKSRIATLLLAAVLVAVLAMMPAVAVGQTYHTSSKKAVKSYKKAKNFSSKKNYAKALKFTDRALYSDDRFVEALQLKGDLGVRLNDDAMAVEFYEKSLAADSTVYPGNAVKLANLYSKKNEFSKAIRVLKWYCGLKNIKENNRKVAENLLINSEFRYHAVNNPVKFNPVNLGETVNTDGDEYVNQILPDGSKIYFTRRLNEKDEDGYRIESVYYSTIVDGQYMPSVKMALDWDNNKRFGVVNISPDEKKMFFVGFDWLDSNGRGDIYCSESLNGKWGKPKNLGNVINTPTLEAQPCQSPDGKELYFTRYSRVNETTDIYVSSWFKDKWTNPQSITVINSKGNEMSPFIHPDGKTLYFVSDGLPGMGGYDVFMCKRNEKGEWGNPVNLGYPLNTADDEISFAVSSDGKTGYISSTREGGFGGFDIYSFELDAIDSPEKVDMGCLVLHDLKFELNSSNILVRNLPEIDSVASYLISNPKSTVEITGFTDDSGSSQHNLELSLKRAQAVKKALVERSVDAKRIKAIGYGENRPLVPNDNEAGRAMNRRVEIRFY